MGQFRRLAVSSVVPSLFFLSLHREVHLYLDAGTGSIVLQAVLGALVGALVAIKLFWNQIKVFFRKIFHMGKTHAEEPDTEE